MATSLDDVLADDAPPVVAPPAAEPPKGEAPKGEAPPPAAAEPVERVTSRRAAHRAKEMAAQGRDPETGKFLPKDAAAPAVEKTEPAPAAAAPAKAPPAQEMTDKEKAAFAAAADERRKRQALEQELARMRGQPAGSQPQPAAQPNGQPAAEKKFWDDPEGFFTDFEKKTRSAAEQVAMTTRLNTSEMLARHRYKDAGDFDANVAIFAEVMQTTPGLAQQWLAAPDPAEFAYRTGKNHRELREAGGLDAMREKLEKELRVKLEAELKEKMEAERAQRAAIPSSLSDVRGAAPQPKAVFTGPTPLSEIVKR